MSTEAALMDSSQNPPLEHSRKKKKKRQQPPTFETEEQAAASATAAAPAPETEIATQENPSKKSKKHHRANAANADGLLPPQFSAQVSTPLHQKPALPTPVGTHVVESTSVSPNQSSSAVPPPSRFGGGGRGTKTHPMPSQPSNQNVGSLISASSSSSSSSSSSFSKVPPIPPPIELTSILLQGMISPSMSASYPTLDYPIPGHNDPLAAAAAAAASSSSSSSALLPPPRPPESVASSMTIHTGSIPASRFSVRGSGFARGRGIGRGNGGGRGGFPGRGSTAHLAQHHNSVRNTFDFASLEGRFQKPPDNLMSTLKANAIGQGNSGTVYAHEFEGKRCAVKVVTVKDKWSLHEVEMFEKFGKEAAKRYGFIALEKCFYCPATRNLFLVMEKMDGDLLELIRAHKFTEGFIVDMVQRLLKTLEFFHNQKFAHMDLKPSNILYRPLKEFRPPCELDAGFCEFILSDLENLENMDDHHTWQVGEFAYMAPEVYMRRPRTTKSDIWNLGMTILHLTNGSPPYARAPRPVREEAYVNQPVVFVPSKPEMWSQGLNLLIGHCLIRDPQHRLSASELLLTFFPDGKFRTEFFQIQRVTSQPTPPPPKVPTAQQPRPTQPQLQQQQQQRSGGGRGRGSGHV